MLSTRNARSPARGPALQRSTSRIVCTQVAVEGVEHDEERALARPRPHPAWRFCSEGLGSRNIPRPSRVRLFLVKPRDHGPVMPCPAPPRESVDHRLNTAPDASSAPAAPHGRRLALEAKAQRVPIVGRPGSTWRGCVCASVRPRLRIARNSALSTRRHGDRLWQLSISGVRANASIRDPEVTASSMSKGPTQVRRRLRNMANDSRASRPGSGRWRGHSRPSRRRNAARHLSAIGQARASSASTNRSRASSSSFSPPRAMSIRRARDRPSRRITAGGQPERMSPVKRGQGGRGSGPPSGAGRRWPITAPSASSVVVEAPAHGEVHSLQRLAQIGDGLGRLAQRDRQPPCWASGSSGAGNGRPSRLEKPSAPFPPSRWRSCPPGGLSTAASRTPSAPLGAISAPDPLL